MKKMLICLLIIILFRCESSVYGVACTGTTWSGDLNQDCYVRFEDFGIIANNWYSSQSSTPVSSTVDTYKIQAENCTLTLLTEDTAGSAVEVGVSGGQNGVYACGGNWESGNNASGTCKLTIPSALPDGEYQIKIHYKTGAIADYAGGFAILIGANNGKSVVENGIATQNGWHTYNPEPRYGTAADTWYDASFAGPSGSQGWFCPVSEGSPLPASVTLRNIQAGDLYFLIWDMSIGNYAYAFIDYVEFIRTAVVVQAEDCTLSWTSDSGNAYPYLANGMVYVTGGDGAFNSTGSVTFAMNQAIPDGDYEVSIKLQTGAVHAPGSGSFAILIRGDNATVVENGITTQNGWHTYYPSDASVTAQTNYTAYLASATGSNGWFCPVYEGSPLATSITLEGVDAGDLKIHIWDQIFTNYDYVAIDYIAFRPITIPGKPLRFQAEKCGIESTPHENWPNSVTLNDGSSVYVMADSGSAHNAMGTATFTIPSAIPDGEYVISCRYQTGAVNADNSGGQFTALFGPVSGSDVTIVKNGTAYQEGVYTYYPSVAGGAAENTWYDMEFTPTGFPFDVYIESPLPQTVTISGCDANEFQFAFEDSIYTNYNYARLDYFEFTPILKATGDLTGDNFVDLSDLSVLVSQWLFCNDPINPICDDIQCDSPPAVGVTEYKASAAPASVTIDGVLNEWPAFDYSPEFWCTSKWVPLDKVYYGSASNVENAYMCLMYDANQNVIYGAVIVDDYDGVYGYSAWDGQDDMEVYIQGNPDNDSPVSPFGTWANAQQFVIGLNSDKTTTYTLWADGQPLSAHGAPGLVASVKRTVPGNPMYLEKLVYEFKIVPYDNYSFDGATTVQTDITSGSVVGVDIVLGVKDTDPAGFGMFCPNLLTGKAYNVTKYATVICE